MSPARLLTSSVMQETSGDQCNSFIPFFFLSFFLEPLKKVLLLLRACLPLTFSVPLCFGSVVVWSIAKREAICGSPAAGLNVGNATTVIFSRCRDEMFVTAGKYVSAVRVFRTPKSLYIFVCVESKVIPIGGNPVLVLRNYFTS